MTFRKLKLLAAAGTALAAMSLTGGALAQETPGKVKIGYAISKTGPNSGGAMTSQVPNYELWVKEMNEKGGMMVNGKRLPVEVVEYDDRSNSEEAVRAVERLITQDKVDLLLSPWGTAVNLAVGPLFAKHKYIQMGPTAITDRSVELAKRWPLSFWLAGTSASYVDALVDQLVKLKKEGKIDEKIAMAAVGDGFGVDLSGAARKALPAAGFKIVYDKTYPVGTQDLSPIINEVKAMNAKVFVAFSYPPDTIGLTEQARLLSYNPDLFMVSVGGFFPLYKQRFGDAVEGVVTLGGIDAKSKAIADYMERHRKATGREPDRSASVPMYASLQVLEQAVERVGLDREKIAAEMKSGSFDTIMGKVSMPDQTMPTMWKIGQWQNGELQGLGPSSLPGAGKITFPKPAWPAKKD